MLSKGVAQVLNRLDGKPFDDADQRLFEVRDVLFCSNNSSSAEFGISG